MYPYIKMNTRYNRGAFSFKGILRFPIEINIFLPVSAKPRCPSNFSLFLIGQQDSGHSSRLGPLTL
jgi:hypothetical protein